MQVFAVARLPSGAPSQSRSCFARRGVAKFEQYVERSLVRCNRGFEFSRIRVPIEAPRVTTHLVSLDADVLAALSTAAEFEGLSERT